MFTLVVKRAPKMVKARDLFRRDLRKARAKESRSQNKMASQMVKANRKVSQKASMVGSKTMATIPKAKVAVEQICATSAESQGILPVIAGHR